MASLIWLHLVMVVWCLSQFSSLPQLPQKLMIPKWPKISLKPNIFFFHFIKQDIKATHLAIEAPIQIMLKLILMSMGILQLPGSEEIVLQNSYNETIDVSWCQFHQHSMGSFWASRFTLILLLHGVKHTAFKLNLNSSWAYWQSWT